MKQSLFVYGTLEVSEVISSLIGREKLSSTAFALDHFRCLLKGQVYPGMVPYLGRVTSGRLYIDLTDSDFKILDHFEGSMYRREQINVYLLKGGVSTASHGVCGGSPKAPGSQPGRRSRIAVFHSPIS